MLLNREIFRISDGALSLENLFLVGLHYQTTPVTVEGNNTSVILFFIICIYNYCEVLRCSICEYGAIFKTTGYRYQIWRTKLGSHSVWTFQWYFWLQLINKSGNKNIHKGNEYGTPILSMSKLFILAVIQKYFLYMYHMID